MGPGEKDMSLIERAVGRLDPREGAGRSSSRNPMDQPNDGSTTGHAGQAQEGSKATGEKAGIVSGAPVPGERGYAELDINSLKAEGFLTLADDRNPVAEEFRIIKRPLLANAFGRGAELVEQGNLIMVTSALPGEGKTFTAVNLAMSIALEMDKTVLLVDADVGRARIHKLFGMSMGPGLIDLLLDRSLDVSNVITKTNIPKLRVITMGRYHPHSNELLASAEMLRLVTELAQRYPDRVVIFDAPPLLVTSESVVLSGLMGQIVFVVRSGRTLQGSVNAALELLDSNKPIGLVLNKVSRGIAGYGAGYGSGYGYGYGYGYGHGYHRKA